MLRSCLSRFQDKKRAERSRPRLFSECEQQRSARVSFGRCKLVSALPGGLHFPGRSHPGLELAATGDPLELSISTGVLPCSFNGHLGAAWRDLALKSTPVATVRAMIIDEVAALAAFAVNDVGGTPIGDRGVIPLFIRGLLRAANLGKVQLVIRLVGQRDGRLHFHIPRKRSRKSRHEFPSFQCRKAYAHPHPKSIPSPSAPTAHRDSDAVVLTDVEVVGAAGLDFLRLGQPNLLIKPGQARVGILDRRELLVAQSREAP